MRTCSITQRRSILVRKNNIAQAAALFEMGEEITTGNE